MGDVVSLSKTPIDLTSDAGRAFVVDATRAAEGLITDRELADKYELSPVDWSNITKDLALGRAIRAERERRVFSGVAARESAAKHFVRMPTRLAGIADSEHSSPRYVIEAAKEIRAVATAGGGDSGSPTKGELFSIVINLGADCVTRHEFDLAADKARRLEEKSDGDE